MTDVPEHEDLGAMLDTVKKDAESYFDRAEAPLEAVWRPGIYNRAERDHFWRELPQELRYDAETLTQRLLILSGHIADAVRKAPLASEADQRDVMTGTKRTYRREAAIRPNTMPSVTLIFPIFLFTLALLH